MPRRRPTGKSNSRSKPRPVDRKDSKIKRWNKASDIELDDEDQFHTSRDKILLNGDEDIEDEDGDDDEVFALEGVSDENSEEAEEDEDDEDDDEDPVVTKSKSKAKTKSKKPSSPSDTGSEDESWGRSKSAYYSSNAAQIDSEDEEANELEEQEARRLQVKARGAIHEEDFGLDEGLEPESDAEVEDSSEEKSRPPIDVSLNDKKTILQHLERENPEALALARDWDDTARNLIEMQAKIAATSEKETDGIELGLLHMYYQALLTYATTLAYYLHLRSSEKYANRPLLLRQHPILNRLLTLKQSLVMLENLGVGTDSQDEDDEDDKYEDEYGEPESETPDLWSILMAKGLESDELADLLMDADDKPRKAPKKDKIEVKPPKKKRKTSDDKNEQPIFDLVEPDFEAASTSAKKKRSAPADVSSTDAFGETTFLQHVDATDKQARKKSLRFHVSRIESATARRQNARINAVGGDDDIPYRERKKEKEQRMEKERQRKAGTLGMGGDDLDDINPEITDASRSKKRLRDVDVEDDDDSDTAAVHGYYELVRRQAADKKSKKKIDYEEARAAERLVFGEHDAASGPRSVTRAIMKNKGLTPHRSKSVRNPRVKKRQKYEQAKKRVSSQRAVYKGGIGDASKYTGEQSGISKVVKSVRLG
ncbi:hypothetical protein BDR04DRAFT_1054222 [Suillus decipiens]|nr:hypothetical protein BDR04DRAFT_1054222 [Suillus decipiens]